MTLVDPTPPDLRDRRTETLPVAIVGAGPIGLAAAANLVERGIPFTVFEAGTVADSMRSWGHIRLFSPWRHLVDPASGRLLEASDWRRPDDATLPTGTDLVRDYLAPLAALPQIAEHLETGVEVTGISRSGYDRTRTAGRTAAPFVLRLRHADATVSETRARAVIDASGTYRTPNALGSSGLDPIGIETARDAITPALPDVLGADRTRFAGRDVIVAGAGHSAANTLLALAELAMDEPGTLITWVIRSAAARVTASTDDELPARASIGRRVEQLVASGRIRQVDRFEIVEVRRDGDRVEVIGDRAGAIETLTGDLIVNATGFRPDLGLLREIRLDLDEIVEAPRRLAPLIDPNVHTCGTVEPHGFAELAHPEEGFFIAGMKSYGRAPTFLLATGYEQVRSIVAHLAGDRSAAARTELVLPATGVCSTSAAPADPGTVASSCCGGTADAGLG